MGNGLNNTVAGIGGGLEGLTRFLQYRQEQKRLDLQDKLRQDEAARASAESKARLATEELQQQALRNSLSRFNSDEAGKDLTQNIQVRGLESTLDDPATVDLAKRAGVNLPTKPLVPFKMLGGATDTAGNELDSQQVLDQFHTDQGLFPHSGVVKPPEIQEKEVERELAIRKAQQVQSILQSLGGNSGVAPTSPSGAGFSPEEVKRLRLRLGLGMNPNDVFGAIRQTPEEAAAIAKAQAEARLPYQQQLIKDAAAQRGLNAGDPYFNSALQGLMSILPPLTPETVDKVVEAAAGIAQKAQGIVPRGSNPSLQPPRAGASAPKPPAAPPSIDATIDDAVTHFGGYDQALAASKDPAVQARLKAAGIDPAAYLRRMTARKVLESLGNPR